MKKFFLLLVLVSQAAFAGDNKYPIEGSTIAEKRIRWVWKNIGTFVASCMFDEKNCSTPPFKKVVDQLAGSVPMSSDFDVEQWQKKIIFKSESEFNFVSDQGEVHRIAMTGLQKEDPIYFNLDRISNSDGSPLEYENYVGILIHELVHHLGYTDDDQRWPDQIGALLSNYFKNQTSYSPFTLVPGDRLGFIVFNSVGPMNWSAVAFEIQDQLVDIRTWESGVTNPCRTPYDMVTEQKIERPRWSARQLRIKDKALWVRGGASVTNKCVSAFGPNKDPYYMTSELFSEVKLIMPDNVSAANWISLRSKIDISSVSLGSITDPVVLQLEKNSIYTFKSDFSTVAISPAKTMVYDVEIEDTADNKFTRCTGNLTSDEWPYLQTAGIPKTIATTSCQITVIDKNKKRVQLTYKIPDQVISQNIQLFNISLYTEQTLFLAYPQRPLITAIEGNFKPGQSPLKVSFQDVTSLTNLGSETLTNSYKTTDSDLFTVVLDIQTKDELLRADFNSKVVLHVKDHLAAAGYGGPIEVEKQMIVNKKKTVQDGHTIYQLQFQIPKQVNNIPCYGFKFVSFEMLTSNLDYVQVNYPQEGEGMVLSPRLLKLPQVP